MKPRSNLRSLISLGAAFISVFYRFRPHLLVTSVLLLLARSISEGFTLLLLIPLIGFVRVGPGTDGEQQLHASRLKLFSEVGVASRLEHVLALFLLVIIARGDGLRGDNFGR